jgi:integrase
MAYLYKRKNIYYIIKKEKGIIVYSRSTGKEKRKDANEDLKDYYRNEYDIIVKSKDIICSKFKDEYMNILRNIRSEKTLVSISSAFNVFIRGIGDKELKDYTQKEIDIFMSRNSLWTAARIRRTLNPAWKLAIKWGYTKKNPWEHTIKIKLPESEPKFITKEQYLKLISIIDNEVLKDIITFASHTGLRQMEIIRLKPRHIDMDKKIITVLSTKEERTKAGKTRYVELHDSLIPIVEKYKAQDFLFLNPVNNKPYAPKTLWENFKKYTDKAKFKDICFHSLRSTYGMWLLEAGVNLKFISQQLGHSSIAVTEKHYAKYIPNKYYGEVNKIKISSQE